MGLASQKAFEGSAGLKSASPSIVFVRALASSDLLPAVWRSQQTGDKMYYFFRFIKHVWVTAQRSSVKSSVETKTDYTNADLVFLLLLLLLTNPVLVFLANLTTAYLRSLAFWLRFWRILLNKIQTSMATNLTWPPPCRSLHSMFDKYKSYFFFFLSFLQGETSSQNGGENVTSRQHDWGGWHGPPGTIVRRLLQWEPEKALWPQWDLCK